MGGENSAKPSDSAANTNGDLIGQQLGDFKIHKLLGKGGMGEVYLAEQVSLKRRVALKILKRDLVTDQKYLDRFHAEAKAVAPISHPNIVSVISIGEEEGVHYIALEYVQGMNLRDYINRKGRLDLPTCRFVMRKVAEALQRAGEEGIVHRDIKPENVLVTRKNEVKVADFGLARQLTGEKVDLTQTGVTMGTPLYMSPEQVEGKKLDPRSDLYSFGIMCYHVMTGQPPFKGETAMAVAIQHVKGKAEPLSILRPDLPSDLIAIVEKLMEKNPNDRYQTAKEVIRDLNRLKTQSQAPTEATEELPTEFPSDSQPSTKTSKQKLALTETFLAVGRVVQNPRYRKWIVALCLLLSLCGGAAYAWQQREAPALAANPSKTFAQAPDFTNIEKRKDAWVQLRWAKYGLPEEQREAGLWAVLAYHPDDEEDVIEAARELFREYLARRDYDLATMVANVLIGQEKIGDKYVVWCKLSRRLVELNEPVENGKTFLSPEVNAKVVYDARPSIQRIFGYLFKGIVLSRLQKADASNAYFLEMFSVDKKTELRPSDMKWLAREYFLALDVNTKIMGQERDKGMTERFWQYFSPKGGPGRS